MRKILVVLILGFTFFISHAFPQNLEKARQRGEW